MDILITLVQYATLVGCVGVILFVVGALPYALGRIVGRLEAEKVLAELAAGDRLQFHLRVAEIEVRGARLNLAREEVKPVSSRSV